LSVIGDLSFGPTGRLIARESLLGGSLVAVSGHAVVDGTLQYTSDLNVGGSDLFTVMTHGSRTGTFAAAVLPSGWSVQYNPGDTSVYNGPFYPTIFWDNESGDSLWSNPLNWSLNRLPAAGDDVWVTRAGAVTHASGDDSVGRLFARQDVTLGGGSLTLGSASTLVGGYTQTGGTLLGVGDLSLAGASVVRAGVLDGPGRLINEGTLTFAPNPVALNDPAPVRGTRPIVNRGAMDWAAGFSGLGRVSLTGGITNEAGATLTLPAFASAGSTSTFFSAGTIDNAGTFNVGRLAGTTVNNTGTTNFLSQGGSFDRIGGNITNLAGGTLAGSGRVTGTVVAEAGSTVRFGTLTLDGGSLTLNTADVQNGAVYLDSRARLTVNAPGTRSTRIANSVFMDSGSSIITVNAANPNLAGSIEQRGGSFQVNADAGLGSYTLVEGGINLAAGTTATVSGPFMMEGSAAFVQGAGDLRLTGVAAAGAGGSVIRSGTLEGTGRLINEGTLTFAPNPVALNDPAPVRGTRPIVNRGAMDWAAGFSGLGRVSLTGGITNEAGATLTLPAFASAGSTSTFFSAGTIDNAGTFNVGRLAGTTVNNTGTTNFLSQGGSFDRIGGNITNLAGGTLAGSGRVTGTVVAEAGSTVRFGTLTLDGGSLTLNTADVQNGAVYLDSRARLTVNAPGTRSTRIANSVFMDSGSSIITVNAANPNLAGSLEQRGGSFQVNADAGLGSYTQTGGIVQGAGNLELPGSLVWSGGTMAGIGTTTLLGTGTVSGTPTLNRVFNNAGSLDIAAGARLVAGAGGALINQPTGTLRGTGTIDMSASGSALRSDGTMAPGGIGTIGRLNITGNVHFGATGKFAVDLAGETVGAFDWLLVSGTARFDGGASIPVSLLNYAAPVGARYAVLGTGGGVTLAGPLNVQAPAGYDIGYAITSAGFDLALEVLQFTPPPQGVLNVLGGGPTAFTQNQAVNEFAKAAAAAGLANAASSPGFIDKRGFGSGKINLQMEP
jgi:hypothetical protein